MAETTRPLRESVDDLLQDLHGDARFGPAESAMAARSDADAVDSPPLDAAPQSDPEEFVTNGRYDHSLAEFPAFRFGKRRRSPNDLIRFSDTIAAPNCPEKLVRTWTVYPSARWGYGGATTQATLFDLHQIWKVQGFRGNADPLRDAAATSTSASTRARTRRPSTTRAFAATSTSCAGTSSIA